MQLIKNDDETTPDGVIMVPVEPFHEAVTVVLLVLEVKNEVRTGADPITREHCHMFSAGHKSLCLCCNCPLIILAVAGLWSCVISAIYLEKGVVNPLTTFIPLIPFLSS